MDTDHSRPDREISRLRDAIDKTFPAERFTGAITKFDPGAWTEDLDEEEALHKALKDRTWSDVSPDFLKANPDAYLRLTPQAYTAFIAAWLSYSLEHMEGANEIREFLIYTCSPPGHSWEILAPLNKGQREIVRALILKFATSEPNSFVRGKAIKALARVNELIKAGQYVPWSD